MREIGFKSDLLLRYVNFKTPISISKHPGKIENFSIHFKFEKNDYKIISVYTTQKRSFNESIKEYKTIQSKVKELQKVRVNIYKFITFALLEMIEHENNLSYLSNYHSFISDCINAITQPKPKALPTRIKPVLEKFKNIIKEPLNYVKLFIINILKLKL